METNKDRETAISIIEKCHDKYGQINVSTEYFIQTIIAALCESRGEKYVITTNAE